MRAISCTRASPVVGTTWLAIWPPLFAHQQVVVGASRHLGQVRHGQHLAVLAQLLHQAPHGFGHGAADARIDLVKDQGASLTEFAGGDRDGQRDAREFAP